MRADLQEMVEQAREVETMLEQDLQTAERRLAQVDGRLRDCQAEAQGWKEKYLQSEKERDAQVTRIQADMAKLTRELAHVKASLRDEELKHDDLERHDRIVESSLGDVERRYNEVLEKNADLESELAMREDLAVECQRLKDTVRDLQSELLVAQSASRISPLPQKHQLEPKEDVLSESEVSSQKKSEYHQDRPSTIQRSASIQASSDLLGRLSAISARMSGISENYRIRSAIPVPRRFSQAVSIAQESPSPISSSHRPMPVQGTYRDFQAPISAKTPSATPFTTPLSRRHSSIPAPASSQTPRLDTFAQPSSTPAKTPATRTSALTRPLPRPQAARQSMGPLLNHSQPLLPSTFGSPTVAVKRPGVNGAPLAALPSSWTREQMERVEGPTPPQAATPSSLSPAKPSSSPTKSMRVPRRQSTFTRRI